MKFRRRAVSELYASMLMIGVTLSFGSLVVASAVQEFGLSTNSASGAVAAQETSAGQQVSLLYGTVNGLASTSCTQVWGGGTYKAQTTYTLALYNYGSVAFTPNEMFDNGTLVATWSGSPSSTLPSGGSTVYTLTTTCARPSGQTFLFVDASGDEVQIGT